MEYCKGCGVLLQSANPKDIGYRLRDGQMYCQRCFRLMHYGDYETFDHHEISNQEILQKIAVTDALYCWVVDLFNLEGSNISGLSKALSHKDVILCLTKRDLLPKNLNNLKISKIINQLLDRLSIELKGWVVLSIHSSDSLDDLIHLVNMFRNGREVIFIGTSNAGKSTLINRLVKSSLTVSALPKTTRGFVKIKTEALGTIYDSAGFVHEDSILNHLTIENRLKLLPLRSVIPVVFQIYEPQVLFFEGLGWISLEVAKLSTVTCYFSEHFKIHRTSIDKTASQWQRLRSEAISVADAPLQTKSFTISTATDFVLKEVGWFTLKGEFTLVETHFVKPVKLILRRAFI